MTLAAGTRLGPYEILSPIGSGGMGEVYRARDTRLGREAAIKVLPAAFARDEERLARFEQEARSASALNHAGIVTIYEIGRADDTPYIAMELVDGRTLRDQLSEGATPLRRLLAQASQMADALARAHEAGIVHRDLKPENVMTTRDGIKILDFGLAKLIPRTEGDSSQLATAIEPTRSGVVIGTAGYMSPEQASGKAVDFRSDQFALGSILYEMAAGRRAFSRGTAAETLAAIIRDDPEALESISPGVPAPLRWVIERCLQKDPHDRYAATRDLARDLAQLRDRASEIGRETSSAPPSAARRSHRLIPALAGALLLAGIAVAALLLRPRPATDSRAVRFTVAIPRGTTYAPPIETSRGFSISPDGTRLAIEAISHGHRRLYVRPLDADEATEIEGSIDATAAFWSPDSRSLAFFANGKLRRVPASGGPPVDVCDVRFATVGAWGGLDTILFSNLEPPGIYRVSATGGEPVRVTIPSLPQGQESHLWPQFLSDGERFLFITNRFSGLKQRELSLASLDGKERRTLGRLDYRYEYAAPGWLLYVRDGALMAQAFDEKQGRLSGEPRVVATNVHHHFGPGHASFSVSRNGTIAYQSAAAPLRLAWLDRDGRETGSLGVPSVVEGVRISPDGSRAAVDIADPRTGTSDVWVFDLASGVSTRLHTDSADEKDPVWSPDGSRLYYRSDRTGPPDIYVLTLRDSTEKNLHPQPGVEQPEDASRDGRVLVSLHQVQSEVWNVQLLALGDRPPPTAWLATRFSQTSPRLSPDGRWIAYASDESGDPEVYVAATEGGADKRRISAAGGRRPRWRADGRELFFLAPGGVVMAAEVRPGESWTAAAPQPLFRLETEIENWDVTPDGARFLVTMPVEKTRESPLHVILNWPEALKNP